MGSEATISKQRILDAAFALAMSKGLASLSIRAVAGACSVAVGTIYNYYPAKGDLIADVVERFWKQAVTDELMRPFPGEGFVEFCERLSHELHGIFGGFRDTWLVQMAMMDRPSLEESRRKEAAYFEHVRAGLEAVLASDARVDPGVFDGQFTRSGLCAFVWESIVASLRHEEDQQSALFALLRHTLYRA